MNQERLSPGHIDHCSGRLCATGACFERNPLPTAGAGGGLMLSQKAVNPPRACSSFQFGGFGASRVRRPVPVNTIEESWTIDYRRAARRSRPSLAIITCTSNRSSIENTERRGLPPRRAKLNSSRAFWKRSVLIPCPTIVKVPPWMTTIPITCSPAYAEMHFSRRVSGRLTCCDSVCRPPRSLCIRLTPNGSVYRMAIG